MAPTLNDDKPEIGDLIEIFRGIYKHWAVYIGDGYVIHLAPGTEEAGVRYYIKRSEPSYRAVVKKEGLMDVVGTDKWRINNFLDKKHEPRLAHVIIQEAKKFLNLELPYCFYGFNCQHFATWLRNGKAQSSQVSNALLIVGGVLITICVVVVAAVLLRKVNVRAMFDVVRRACARS